MKSATCPECGARLSAGATQCGLCGTPVEAPAPPAVSAPPPPVASGGDRGRSCESCGAGNPPHARFCLECGTALAVAPPPPAHPTPPPVAEASPSPPPSGADPAGKRAIALVGGAALLVIALFAATQLGGPSAPLVPPDAAAAGAGGGGAVAAATAQPIPPEAAARAAALEDQIAAATDPNERLARQIELVEVLVQAGAFAQAAAVQEAIARSIDTPSAWADAGSFYLAHMFQAEGDERITYAQRSAQAYEAALERDPADLDAKTDLATAYLNDPMNPMRAVEVVREVLDANPDHARARFNYGLMLGQIGRIDQAREQFEHVVTVTTPGDLVHERAREELDRLTALTSG